MVCDSSWFINRNQWDAHDAKFQLKLGRQPGRSRHSSGAVRVRGTTIIGAMQAMRIQPRREHEGEASSRSARRVRDAAVETAQAESRIIVAFPSMADAEDIHAVFPQRLDGFGKPERAIVLGGEVQETEVHFLVRFLQASRNKDSDGRFCVPADGVQFSASVKTFQLSLHPRLPAAVQVPLAWTD